jgi:DNA-binding PadR family transcriptional regulator
MSDRQLTDFEHVLLAMICQAPSSGYDLKQRFAATPMGVYRPSSGALYPALQRLERRGLLRKRVPPRSADQPGRAPSVYDPTPRGRTAHERWVRQPIDPGTVSRDLGLHLLRFVMTEPLLTPAEVLSFLESLRDALTSLIAELERYVVATDFNNRHSPLALRHGIAIHRASLRWVQSTIQELSRTATHSA